MKHNKSINGVIYIIDILKKLEDLSAVSKIIIALLATGVCISPAIYIFLYEKIEFKFSFFSLLMIVIIFGFIITMIMGIFGSKIFQKKITSNEQDERFIKKLSQLYKPFIVTCWFIVFILGLNIVYEIWSK